MRLQYGYNRASSRIWRKDPIAQANSAEYDELYAYDGLQRLSDMQRGTLNSTQTALTAETFAQCWTLDATGNWQQFRQDDDGSGTWDLEQSRTANPVNEITAVAATTGPTWVTPQYDPAGNMTTVPQPADPTQEYTAVYDAWNRLVRLTETGGSSGSSSSSSSSSSEPTVVARYDYDGRNYRISSRELLPTGNVEIRDLYYNEQWQLLEERAWTGGFQWTERQHIWGARYIDDLIVRFRANAMGGILAEQLYALQDANWNVVATLGTTGVLPPTPISERYAYTPYGEPTFLEWDYTPLTESQFDWQTLFTGLRRSQNTGLYYARNRDLHSALGVWTTRDPIGFGDGQNPFEFVGSSPIGRTDPLGLEQVLHIGTIKFPKDTGVDKWDDYIRKNPLYEKCHSPKEFISSIEEAYNSCLDASSASTPEDQHKECCISHLIRQGHGSGGCGNEQSVTEQIGADRLKSASRAMCAGATITNLGCSAFSTTAAEGSNLDFAMLLSEHGGKYEGFIGYSAGEYPLGKEHPSWRPAKGGRLQLGANTVDIVETAPTMRRVFPGMSRKEIRSLLQNTLNDAYWRLRQPPLPTIDSVPVRSPGPVPLP